ncbi:MAG: bifunctional nuclease family protein [Gemmatimonadales bacterium]
MIKVKVAHLGIDPKTKQPVVILKEVDGERVLPIWIGPNEASAIATELAGVAFSRPLTHDLLKQIIIGLGGTLDRAVITELKNDTFYAQLHIHRNDHVVQVDARPSDSIAVALRLGAPIYAADGMLGSATIDTIVPDEPQVGPLDPEDLKTYLQNLDPEDLGKFNP